MRRVFSNDIGAGTNSDRETVREAVEKLSLVRLLKTRTSVRLEHLVAFEEEHSLLRKERLERGQVENDVIGSTAPKSGYALAVTPSAGDGFQNRSAPARTSSSSRAWSMVMELYGMA